MGIAHSLSWQSINKTATAAEAEKRTKKDKQANINQNHEKDTLLHSKYLPAIGTPPHHQGLCQ